MVKYDPAVHTPQYLSEVVKLYGKTWVCDKLKISRPTLDKWLIGNWQIERKKAIKITYEMVIAHVKSKEPSHQTNKILRECEGPKQRQKRLAMDLIDQINELLNE